MRPKKVILCVDDNERDLSIRAFVLESHGYKVVRAGTCDQALDILRVGGIDLVLSDLVLPRMDGNELIRQMKQINPEVPTILFSAQVTSFDRARYADAFLPKGACSMFQILERIRIMVQRKRGPKKGTLSAIIAAKEAVTA